MTTHWFVFDGSDLLLEHQHDGIYAVPTNEAIVSGLSLQGKPLAVASMPNGDAVMACRASLSHVSQLQEGHLLRCNLRKSFYFLPEDLWQEAGKCHELLYWDERTHFCGKCGAPMAWHTDISKVCTQCGDEIWPVVSPAVIVLIGKGDKVLLTRNRNFRGRFHGLVAGFVETGESLEEAVCREVQEETGITIQNLHYFGSQPWPFPCGIMLGFTADYAAGEPRVVDGELMEVAWYHRDHLPLLPDRLSIARRLIEEWKRKKENNP